MTHERGERLVAGPAQRSGATVVVPVSRVSAELLGTDRGVAFGGSAHTQLLGVWVDSEARPPAWLPAQEEPPDACESWSAWLLAQEPLLQEIRAALAALR